MAGDRKKTAGEAAKEKVERREQLDEVEDAAQGASDAAAAAKSDDDAATPPKQAEEAAAEAKDKAAEAEQAAAEDRVGDETDQRSPQEREKDLTAGSIEPAGVKPTEADSQKSSEELREDVEAAREELADTVEQLGQKIDPRPNIDEAKQRAQSQAATAGQAAQDNAIPIAVGAGLLLGLLIWLWRR